MANNNELEYIQVGRIKLTERALRNQITRIEEKYGVKVYDVVETDNGYIFKGKYGFTIGDLTYNQRLETYNSFNFHNGVKESIAARDRAKAAKKEQAARKRFSLQKGIRIGAAITLTGMIALAGLGVIKHFNDKKASLPDNQPTVVAEVDHLNTVKNANDFILLSWANYAMGRVSETCLNSQYEAVQSVRNDVYANVFVPIMNDYYNYVDMIDSGLPNDIVGESLDRSHASFRNQVVAFDSYLNENFNDFTFSSSPYADAVVTDEMGQVITSSSDRQGELLDISGDVITNDNAVRVYIKLSSIEGHNFTLDNLPEDAIIYNGEAYVLESHLYNNLTQGLNK